MQSLGLTLGILLTFQADPEDLAPESPKGVLRMHLHGVLHHPSFLNFDVPPLYELQGQCNIAGTLIEILEEEAKTPIREQEAMSSVKVLKLYWQKYPDSRIPSALSKYCLDASRPLPVRTEALQTRGLMPGADTPAFYAEAITKIPDLAGTLVMWLRGGVYGNVGKGLALRDLYTPEVRSAVKRYADAQLTYPTLLPEDRRLYQSLIADLDRAVGLPPEAAVPEVHPKSDPVVAPVDEVLPKGSRSDPMTKDVPRVPSTASGAFDSGRTMVALTVVAGVIAILLYRFLRYK